MRAASLAYLKLLLQTQPKPIDLLRNFGRRENVLLILGKNTAKYTRKYMLKYIENEL